MILVGDKVDILASDDVDDSGTRITDIFLSFLFFFFLFCLRAGERKGGARAPTARRQVVDRDGGPQGMQKVFLLLMLSFDPSSWEQ
jgi:hypothetical protein